ncbi:MAG TPA: hypothetical protein VFZ44_12880 [Pyrinomonadaceae bacterium]
MRVRLATASALALLAVSAACYRPSAKCREFYAMAPADRAAKVRSSPADEQLDLYHCGMMQEPPADFSGVIAERGEQVLPALLDRLESTEEESFQDDLIHVLEVMAKAGKLRQRRDVVERVRGVVSKMKFDQFKGSAQKRLATIEGSV